MSENNGTSNKVTRQFLVKKGAWYGKVYMEFGVSETFEISSGTEQQAVIKKLGDIVDFQHQQYLEDFKRIPQNYGQGASAPATDSANGSEEIEPVLEILMNISNGEKQYRVKTPKSHQYGFPIYDDCPSFPEFLKVLGTEISVKPQDYIARTAQGKKGRKVISFEKKF